MNSGYDQWNESEVLLANLMPNNVIMSNGQSDQETSCDVSKESNLKIYWDIRV